MARIRTIKPEFFTSEDIVNLSPLARLLYIALWCEADREGRMAWKPKTFKMRYFPGDSCSIEKLCDELLDSGLIVRYGDQYAYIPAFLSHQHINPREQSSQLPAPVTDASTTRQSRDSDTQGGKEGKGKERKGTRVIEKPDDVSEVVFADFLKIRSAKKAPLTETAMAGIRREAALANKTLNEVLQVCCERGWQSFKAEWLKNVATFPSQQQPPQRPRRELPND